MAFYIFSLILSLTAFAHHIQKNNYHGLLYKKNRKWLTASPKWTIYLIGGWNVQSFQQFKTSLQLSPAPVLELSAWILLACSLLTLRKSSSHTLLSCSNGSMSSSLPRSGLLLWILLMLLLCFLVLLALLCSGMNKATRKARRTAHAPNRKGGPGIIALSSLGSCNAVLSEFGTGAKSLSSTWNKKNIKP